MELRKPFRAEKRKKHARTLRERWAPKVMYRNLYPKSSFRSCPYTVLVKCPVRFYRIFDEIGQNVDGKMYFYHRSHCSTTTIESNGSLFSSLAPAKGYAQKNCAERFSALNVSSTVPPPDLYFHWSLYTVAPIVFCGLSIVPNQ